MDSHYRDYRGHFPDVFDPNFDLWVSNRLACAEFAGYASSPWTIGISSDDTDYLTGFGPGPDFPAEQGNTHPHLGYVVLITPPTQSVSQDGMTRYADPTVYTKQALGDFLRSKYSTIEALNAAWGSNYTSFGSNGGWGSWTGLLDENGSGSWVRHRRRRFPFHLCRVFAGSG